MLGICPLPALKLLKALSHWSRDLHFRKFYNRSVKRHSFIGGLWVVTNGSLIQHSAYWCLGDKLKERVLSSTDSTEGMNYYSPKAYSFIWCLDDGGGLTKSPMGGVLMRCEWGQSHSVSPLMSESCFSLSLHHSVSVIMYFFEQCFGCQVVRTQSGWWSIWYSI